MIECALYLFKDSREELEPCATWGGAQGELAGFDAEDCWALRRGKSHAVPDPQHGSICRHVASGQAVPPYICIPLIVQSDPLGLWWSTPAEHDAPEVARGARTGAPFSIMMLDLDYFKCINDTFGHDAGDVVLRRVAGTVQENTRVSDIVCRYGGEEFMIVLPGCDRDGAVARAERVLPGVRSLHVVHDGELLGPLTISIGIALYPKDGATQETVVQAADQALYAAKGAGRDQLMVAGE